MRLWEQSCKLAYCEVYERKKIRVQTAGMARSSREEGIRRSAMLGVPPTRGCVRCMELVYG